MQTAYGEVHWAHARNNSKVRTLGRKDRIVDRQEQTGMSVFHERFDFCRFTVQLPHPPRQRSRLLRQPTIPWLATPAHERKTIQMFICRRRSEKRLSGQIPTNVNVLAGDLNRD